MGNEFGKGETQGHENVLEIEATRVAKLASKLVMWMALTEEDPKHNPGAIIAAERIAVEAENLYGVRRERLLETAHHVLYGIYEAQDAFEVNDKLPKLIDRFDISLRGGRTRRQTYGHVLSVLGFKPVTVSSNNDYGMRVTETTYVSPNFAGEDSCVTITELIQRKNDITFLAEVQPSR